MQTWSERKLVMAPDAIDDAQAVAAGDKWGEFYNMSVFPYGGQYLGFITCFHFSRGTKVVKDIAPGQSGHDGPIDVQLTHSRDGRTWERLQERQPVIPNGPYAYDADASSGELRIAALDASGQPIPGYAAEDCLPITSDSVRHIVRWPNRDHLSVDQPIRLRFEMKDTALFSYRVAGAE